MTADLRALIEAVRLLKLSRIHFDAGSRPGIETMREIDKAIIAADKSLASLRAKLGEGE